ILMPRRISIKLLEITTGLNFCSQITLVLYLLFFTSPLLRGEVKQPADTMTSMRGLVQFIADLRNARARELEEKRINKELANIRQKFKEGGLNGYQKKKYVCKLLYVYI